MLGSGGSGPNIPKMNLEEAGDYIHKAQVAGLDFNYLLNAPCMNNMEWHEATHRALLQHIETLSDMGVRRVAVAIPYLIELIKSQFPHISVEVSTIAHVNSVARARFFESLGADSIILDANINRDFRLLKAIRNAVSLQLGVLTNSSCLYQCPYEYYHNNTLGHASQNHNQLNGFYMDYCVLHCSLANFSDTSQFIKARWIRPEDLPLYEEMGIDFFKIGGRKMPTEWIINAAEAYTSGPYPGNLYDILNNFSPKTRNVAAGRSQPAAVMAPPRVYIDNQKMGGFIEFFKKQDCVSGCAQCHYCQDVADRAVTLDSAEVAKYVATLKTHLGDLSSSRVFGIRDSCASGVC